MTFAWPGAPAGWATGGTPGDGTIETVSTSDRKSGFRVDGRVTLPKLNGVVRELANQIGFLYRGGAVNIAGATVPAGSVMSWPRLGALVDNTPVGGLAMCSEFDGSSAPFYRVGVSWSSHIKATWIWTDGSDAVWWAYDDGGTASTYGSARRQTMVQTSGVDWTTNLAAGLNAVSLTGVNKYLYVVVDDTSSLGPPTIRKVLKTTGRVVATVNLSGSASVTPAKIVSNGQVLCVIVGNSVQCYDLDLVLQWTWARGSAVNDIAITGDALFAVGDRATVDAVADVNLSRISLTTGLKTHQVTNATLDEDLDHVATDGRVVIATADVQASANVLTVTCSTLLVVEVRQLGDTWKPRNIVIDHGTIYLTTYDSTLLGTVFQMFSRSWVPIGQIAILGLEQFDVDGLSFYVPGNTLSGASISRFGLGMPGRMFRRNDPEASPYGLWNKLVIPL